MNRNGKTHLSPLSRVCGGRRGLLLPLLVVEPGLLGVHLVRVVVEVLAAEQEAELGVFPLDWISTKIIVAAAD